MSVFTEFCRWAIYRARGSGGHDLHWGRPGAPSAVSTYPVMFALDEKRRRIPLPPCLQGEHRQLAPPGPSFGIPRPGGSPSADSRHRPKLPSRRFAGGASGLAGQKTSHSM